MLKLEYEVPPQSGRLAVVTGTGGLGYQVALALVRAGARMIIAGRNSAKGADAVASLVSAIAGAQVEFEALDLASLQTVRDFAARMRARGDAIDILVNNAGIMSPPKRETTAEGHELQFGVNYLGHFALTAELLPLLCARRGSRVVNVTSLAQHYAKLDMDDLQSEKSYRAGKAYCLSKLLQAIFTTELQRRSAEAGWGIDSVAAHPGMAGTNLFDTGGALAAFINKRIVLPLIGQSAVGGAQPILFAATSPDARGGHLYGPTGFMEMKGSPGECDFAKGAHDTAVAAKLWELSEKLAGVRFADAARSI